MFEVRPRLLLPCDRRSAISGITYVSRSSLLHLVISAVFAHTAATGLFCWGGKIDSRLLKFCESHITPLSGMAKCDLAKFKQPAVTFCLLVKIVWPRQCQAPLCVNICRVQNDASELE